MSDNKIKIKNNDGTISEIDVSFDIEKFDKKYRGEESYYKRKTKNYPSFDSLMQQNENCEENEIAKLPVQLGVPSLESEAISNIESEILHKAIEKLSMRQRRRIILRYFKGLNLPEISEIENVSFQAIHKDIEKTLRILKHLLDQ